MVLDLVVLLSNEKKRSDDRTIILIALNSDGKNLHFC